MPHLITHLCDGRSSPALFSLSLCSRSSYFIALFNLWEEVLQIHSSSLPFFSDGAYWWYTTNLFFVYFSCSLHFVTFLTTFNAHSSEYQGISHDTLQHFFRGQFSCRSFQYGDGVAAGVTIRSGKIQNSSLHFVCSLSLFTSDRASKMSIRILNPKSNSKTLSTSHSLNLSDSAREH